MDHNAVGTLDEAEILLALHNEGQRILQIEDVRSVPVWNVVYIALRSCGCDEVAISDRHVYDSVLEVQVLLELNVFREDVSYFDPVFVVQVGLPIVVTHLFVHHLTEQHISITT